MAWNVVKNINNTINSYPGYPEVYWKAEQGAYYIRGHYEMKFEGTLYIDSGNPAHYRVACTVYIRNMYHMWGGYWKGNNGEGVRVSFDGNDILAKQVNLPLSAYKNQGSWSTITSFDKDFTITKKGYLTIRTSCFYPGATRAGSPSYLPAEFRHATSCEGYDGTYTDFINYQIPDPYTPSSIWLNPNDYTKIGRIDSSSWGVHYSYNSGSNSNCPISLAIHDYSKTSWGVRWEPVLRYVTGSSDGVWDYYTLSANQGFASGSRYRITLVSKRGEVLSPNSWNPQDGYVIYTYQEPKINTSLSRTRGTQHANQDNKFTISGTNGRAWSDYESSFQTHYRIKRGDDAYTGWTNLGDITEWSRTAAQMRSLVPKGYDGKTITIQMKRYSPTPNWYSSNTASNTFTVYYRPRAGISSASYRKNNSSGTTVAANNYVIDDSSLTGVYTSWSYDTNSANAGYTQGYRVKLFNAAGNVVKTYYTTAKNITIPKGDIPRIQQTYISITPYYKNDTENANNYWYYTGTETKINFVRIVGNIATPAITYPVNNSNWINNKFRICFTLPTDPDYGTQSGTYLYDNIEVMINNNYTIRMTDSTGQTSTGTCVKNTSCFSTGLNGLTYQRKIIVCPGLISGFPNTSSYTIKVRVRKKYGTSSNNNWSNWSTAITIKNTAISIPNYEGQYILASHYNYMKTTVNRMRNTYSLNWNNAPTDAVVDNTKITYNRYSYNNVLYVLNDIKTRVNSFGTFDNANVKFDSGGSLPTSFTVKQEYITNQETETEPLVGSNYLITILNRCNLLK